MFDLDPTPLQQELLSTMRTFLQRECPTGRVRAVEDLGFDPRLWSQLHSMGIVDMSLPADHEVFGAGLLDAALVCELLGEFLTPAPVVESVVAARLLSGLGGPVADELLVGIRERAEVVVLALHPAVDERLLWVPAGAVAHHVLFVADGMLRVTVDPAPGRAMPNLGNLPLAHRSVLDSRVVYAGADVNECLAGALSE